MQPEMLILDEPTSGVDPVARDGFWEFLIDLSREDSVTIFVSTHFMNEAERCDRISLMHAGKVLVSDTPAAIVATRGAATLEEAFIGYLEDAIAETRMPQCRNAAPDAPAAATATAAPARRHSAALRSAPHVRLYAAARRWSCAATRSAPRLRCSAA